MWHFSWARDLGLACSFTILNALCLKMDDTADASEARSKA